MMIAIPQPTIWRPQIWTPVRCRAPRPLTPLEQLLRGMSNWFMATKGKGQFRPSGKGCKSLEGKGNANGPTDNICGCVDSSGTLCSNCTSSGTVTPSTLAVISSGIVPTVCRPGDTVQLTGDFSFEGDALQGSPLVGSCQWALTTTAPGALIKKYTGANCTGSLVYTEVPKIQCIVLRDPSDVWRAIISVGRNDVSFSEERAVYFSTTTAGNCTESFTGVNDNSQNGTGGILYAEP